MIIFENNKENMDNIVLNEKYYLITPQVLLVFSSLEDINEYLHSLAVNEVDLPNPPTDEIIDF